MNSIPCHTLLQCAQLLVPTIQETVKKLTNTASIHDSEDSPLSGSSSVSALFKLNMAGETANSRTDGSISSVTTRMAEAILWGVRQPSVRDISQCDAGTLPSFAIAEETNLAEVVCNTMSFEGEQAEEENQPLVGVEVDSSTPIVIKKGEFLAVNSGFEINAPNQVSKAHFYIVMTESDVPDNPNETVIDVMWLSPTKTIDEEFAAL